MKYHKNSIFLGAFETVGTFTDIADMTTLFYESFFLCEFADNVYIIIMSCSFLVGYMVLVRVVFQNKDQKRVPSKTVRRERCFTI